MKRLSFLTWLYFSFDSSHNITNSSLNKGKTHIYGNVSVVESKLYIWVIDQAWGQYGWILAMHAVFFFVFDERDGVEVHKFATKRTRPWPKKLGHERIYCMEKEQYFHLSVYVNIPWVTWVHLYSIWKTQITLPVLGRMGMVQHSIFNRL